MSSKDNEPNISNIKNSDPNMREDRKLANIIKDTHAKLREQIQAIDNKLCPNKSEIEDKLTHSSWSPSPQPRKVGHKKGHGPRILTAPEMPVLRMPILIL